MVITLSVNSQWVHAPGMRDKYKVRAEFWEWEINTLMLCSMMRIEAVRFFFFIWMELLNIMTRPLIKTTLVTMF